MKFPYGIVSDQHFHDWHQFATVGSDGVNSRLKSTLSELRRCADTVKKQGGSVIVNAGDTFHVRGNLTPSVLNPVLDLHRELVEEGLEIIAIPGNHDLENRETRRLSSSATTLEGVGVKVANDVGGEVLRDGLLCVPWISNFDDLQKVLEKWAKSPDANELDVVLHAPLNDVIPGLPDKGLDAVYLKSLGFKRVFCGHYHSNKEVQPSIWSIGALCHQTWSDVGSKAGFMLVYADRVQWFSTHAPQFVEIDGDTDADEIPLLVDGNYVKARINVAKESEIAELRDTLTGFGAAGVVIHAERDHAATSRTGASVSAGASIAASIGDFIKTKGYPHEAALNALCADILDRAEATV